MRQPAYSMKTLGKTSKTTTTQRLSSFVHVEMSTLGHSGDSEFEGGYFIGMTTLPVSAGWAVLFGFSILFLTYVFSVMLLMQAFGNTKVGK